MVEDVRGASSAIEPTVLIAAVEALVALKSGDPLRLGWLPRFWTPRGDGALDLLVTAYRPHPSSSDAYSAEIQIK